MSDKNKKKKKSSIMMESSKRKKLVKIPLKNGVPTKKGQRRIARHEDKSEDIVLYKKGGKVKSKYNGFDMQPS